MFGGTDQLVHHTELPVDADRARGWCEFTGDQSQKRGLADTVCSDQRNTITVADSETDVVEQLIAAGQPPLEMAH